MHFPRLHDVRNWLQSGSPIAELSVPDNALEKINTQHSATVFSGSLEHWADYLGTRRADRYVSGQSLRVHVSSLESSIGFVADSDALRPLADCLEESFRAFQARLRGKEHAAETLKRVIFENESNSEIDLRIRLAVGLPSEAIREVPMTQTTGLPEDVTIAVRATFADSILRRYRLELGKASEDELLGISWPLLRRIVSQLGYSNTPRDRFVEKIDLVTDGCLLAINTLYDGKRHGRLQPNQIGAIYEHYIAERDSIDVRHLHEQHPYFRLLNELSFLLDERFAREYAAEARIQVREYLDDRYLRLSLAGVMPPVAKAMASMQFSRHNDRISTPSPRIGNYGILDLDDLAAWKKAMGPFDKLGFTLLRQLGIGEFGRVYEAINRSNPTLPPRVALKIDRLRRWQSRRKILDPATALQTSRVLSQSPHVIRIFDAGVLAQHGLTYHILQVVDGDTLDNLLGIAGEEHSSVHRPSRPAPSHAQSEKLYTKALSGSKGETWRRARMSLSFTEPLTIIQTLDVLTSVLLWLEKVHELGYAINDLKNGNLMASRRGQVKGIDIDAYCPITSPLDKTSDFLFLAISILLVLVNAKTDRDRPTSVADSSVSSSDALRELLSADWPFGDISKISSGRVSTNEVMDLLCGLIHRCRNRTYTERPDQLTADIDQLIATKRRISLDELVLD